MYERHSGKPLFKLHKRERADDRVAEVSELFQMRNKAGGERCGEPR